MSSVKTVMMDVACGEYRHCYKPFVTIKKKSSNNRSAGPTSLKNTL